MAKKITVSVLLLFGIIIVVSIVYAATSYRVTGGGATTTINEWSMCKKVTNNNSLALFIPTGTSAEWSAFRSYAPSVTLAECQKPCAGLSLGGYCWYAGTMGASCDSTCTTHGSCDLVGTRDYAGSNGTLANCAAIIAALGFPSMRSVDLTTDYFGCAFYGYFIHDKEAERWSGVVTTCAAPAWRRQRICACTL